MKRLTAPLLVPIAIFFIVTSAVAQEQESPMPDRWRGLVIDVSTPEDAIKALGTPDSDKPIKVFKPEPLEKRVSTKGMALRNLVFKNLDKMKLAQLTFADNKLICIALILKEKVSASAIQNIYKVEMEPKIGGMDQAFSPGDYERHEGKLYPKNYPMFYHLIGMTDRVWVEATIENSSTKSMLFGSSRGSGGDGAFPGKAIGVMLLSRAIENEDGADALK